MPSEPHVPLVLADLTVEHVLVVAGAVMASVRGGCDASLMEGRIAMADCLVSLTLSPGGAPIEASGAVVALATFAARCRGHGDPETWVWCCDVFRAAGLDASVLLRAAAPLVKGFARDWHDVPVLFFRPDPDAYGLVPVSHLPFAHNPFRCGHARVYDDRLARLERRDARWAWLDSLRGRPNRSGWQRQQEAAKFMQERVFDGRLPVCVKKHEPQVNWDAIVAAAEDIRITVRPWRESVVEQACRTADGLSERERQVLWSLFFDAISWDGRSDSVGDGQHRVCGLRASGATMAMVAV